MALRRGLRARAEQCCQLAAWSSIFEKVCDCHFLSRRWPLAFPALLCFVEEGWRAKIFSSVVTLVRLLVVALKQDSSWAGSKGGGWKSAVLDLLEWQELLTRPAELGTLSLLYVLGGACGLLAVYLDHPQLWQFGLGLADSSGRKCEISSSQPAARLLMWVSSVLTAKLGSLRQFPKAVFVLQLFMQNTFL